MFKYTIKRLIQSFITILLVMGLVFLLMQMLSSYGFRRRMLRQLAEYYGRFFGSGLGTSHGLQSGRRISVIFSEKIGISLKLGLISLGLSILLGIPLGMLQARHKDRLIDSAGLAFTTLVNTIPELVRYSLILYFGVSIFRFPTMYFVNRPAVSLVLPVVCLTLTSTANYALWMRRYTVDEMSKDYVQLAAMKGLNRRQIMARHVFVNAIVPMLQYLPTSILMTVGGSMLVERYFSIPGMGTLLIDAIEHRDVPLVMGCIFIYSGLGIMGVFLGDILMTLADPRIRLQHSAGSR